MIHRANRHATDKRRTMQLQNGASKVFYCKGDATHYEQGSSELKIEDHSKIPRHKDLANRMKQESIRSIAESLQRAVSREGFRDSPKAMPDIHPNTFVQGHPKASQGSSLGFQSTTMSKKQQLIQPLFS